MNYSMSYDIFANVYNGLPGNRVVQCWPETQQLYSFGRTATIIWA